MTRPNNPIFKYRWVLEYSDHKPTRRGMWSQSSDLKENMACFQSKENLLRAYVERKCIWTKLVEPVMECKGEDWVEFGWVSKSSFPVSFRGTISPSNRIIGISLTTRLHKVEAYEDGFVGKPTRHNVDFGRVQRAGFGS